VSDPSDSLKMTISRDQQATITNRLQNGDSIREAAKAAGVSTTTASKIAKTLNLDNVGGKPGRPRILTDNDQRVIRRKITSGQVDTAVDMAKHLQDDYDIKCSVQTVRNTLKELGLIAKHKIKKPAISRANRTKRLEFAKKHQHWTVEDWKRVVWSDESKINRLGSDGRKWVWKSPGEGLTSRTITPTVKHGGGNVMVWGCMTAYGVGYLCRIDGGLDSELYCNILREELINSIEYYRMDRDHVIFQQDNDPKHTSRRAKECLQDLNLNVLEWPPQSPDLNPIEHLWETLKRQLNAYEDQPTSIHQLWDRVEAEWNKITKNTCLNLIESMSMRIQAVLKSKGGPTKY
jgi:transposase